MRHTGTKESVLALFEENRGTYFSGEEIAARLSVSRAAVWKAVKTLRDEGYEIDAAPNKGYCLSAETDILSAQGIRKYLNPACAFRDLLVLEEAESTNAFLREQASAGSPEGRVVVAGRQTKGRGRLGRSFYSPADTGIYMSLLLRPANLSPDQAVSVTTMAAVAACEAIEEVSGKQAGIKWVNDIYMEGRKVSGILTEAALSMENNRIDFIVLGIGINAYAPEGGFPEEIGEIAGAVFSRRCDDGKNALAAAFLNRFAEYYAARESGDYVEKYRDRSLVTGKEILILSPSGKRRAFAEDVDGQCRLLVRYEDGSREALSSGEISIRFGSRIQS